MHITQKNISAQNLNELQQVNCSGFFFMPDGMTEKIKSRVARLIDAGTHQSVEGIAEAIVKQFGLSDRLVHYTHVEIRNKLNEFAFKKVPFSERVLFLPHCLRNSKDCKASYNDEGLRCAMCGKCSIKSLTELAREREYKGVFVVPGGSLIVKLVRKYNPNAVIGVACNDEINLGLDNLRAAGIPAQAVLLLRDGCHDTIANIDEVKEKMDLIAK